MDKIVRIEYTVKAVTDRHARRIFRLASDRLLHVRNWCRLTDSLLPRSEHRDLHGLPVARPAKADDFINLTDDAMRLFGWMQVTYVAEACADNGSELVLLAKPVGVPFEEERDSALQVKPTLLRVVRKGMEVTAGFVIEANPFIPVFDRLGVYVVQWRSLVNGLLSDLTQLDLEFNPSNVGVEPNYS